MRSYFLEKNLEKPLHNWVTEIFFLNIFSKKEQVDWANLYV
jgi:hypothetical protein